MFRYIPCRVPANESALRAGGGWTKGRRACGMRRGSCRRHADAVLVHRQGEEAVEDLAVAVTVLGAGPRLCTWPVMNAETCAVVTCSKHGASMTSARRRRSSP